MKHWLVVLLMLGGLPFFAARAEGAEPEPLPGVSATPLPGKPLHGVGADIDRWMNRQLKGAWYVPGAAVAVVHDGSIIHSAGYGFADWKAGTPVEPEETLFRMGSVSKPVTATAVMQLVEQGSKRGLDLDEDVNAYLNAFRIPDTFDAPITLRHLLTHTSGFEATFFGHLMVTDLRHAPTLAQWTPRFLPARIRPPSPHFEQGEDAIYANYNYALAGYLIEARTGQAFANYMQTHIFAPLGMRSASFAKPLPQALRDRLARGYRTTNLARPFQPEPDTYFSPATPAFGLVATVNDMARFMISHLNGGGNGDVAILQAQAVQEMHSRQFSPGRYLNGNGLGFAEHALNGRRWLSHEGLTPYFTSEMWLLPTEKFGLIVTYNSNIPGAVNRSLIHKVIANYFPADRPAFEPAIFEQHPVSDYTGLYTPTIRSQRTSEKFFQLFNAKRISSNAPGIVQVPLIGHNGPATLYQVSGQPGLFRQADGDAMLRFEKDEQGKLYALGPEATVPLVRLKRHEQMAFTQVWLHLCGAAWVLMLCVGAYVAVRPAGRAPYRATCLTAAGVALTQLITLGGFIQAVQLPLPSQLVALPPAFNTGVGFSLISTGLTAILLLMVARGWRHPDWTLRGRLACSLLAVAPLAFIAWLHLWNLLGNHQP